MNNKLILFFVLIIAFVACDTNRVFDDFYKVKTTGWHKDSVAVFNFEITDTTLNYDLFISSRNLENYPYSNLWLFVDVVAPDSSSIRDTIEYQMAEPNGKWIGKGTGGIYFIQNYYKSGVSFPINGMYKINIQHGMRGENLKGINNIGLRVAKR